MPDHIHNAVFSSIFPTRALTHTYKHTHTHTNAAHFSSRLFSMFSYHSLSSSVISIVKATSSNIVSNGTFLVTRSS